MNFQDVVKYLDLRKAAKDLTFVTKPLTLFKSRPIKKVRDSIHLEPFFTLGAISINGPTLLFQYNVTVGYPFSLHITPEADLTLTGGFINGALTVKWREGNDVQRYTINVPYLNYEGFPFFHMLAQFSNTYTGQVIPSNCVFEFWSFSSIGPLGVIPAGLTLKLSKLRNPVNADDVGVILQSVTPYVSERFAASFIGDSAGTYGTDLPETLPYDQPIDAWLDN